MEWKSKIVVGCMKWGSWGRQFSPLQYQKLIGECLENELSVFDHADIYGDYSTEAEFGQALRTFAHDRHRLQLISKCGIQLTGAARPHNRVKHYDLSKDYIIRSAEASLNNLQTEYLDVLLLHRPSPLMNIEEIIAAFEELQHSGKVLNFGVSNFTPWQFDLLHRRFPLVTNQVEVSPWQLSSFEDGTLAQCQEHGIRPSVWSPLGGGRLFSGSDPTTLRIRAVTKRLVDQWRCSAADVLFAWLAAHPSNPLIIAGSTRIERLVAAKQALDLPMDQQFWFELYEASLGRPVA